MRNAVIVLHAFLLALLLGLIWDSRAHAQCCPGYSPAEACSGAGLVKSRWCIEDSVPNAQSALPEEFCAYGDEVVATLEQVFNIEAPEVFEFELDAQTGGAHTGTACGRLGDGVAYDAFTGDAYGATGFWGYLLALHEAINDWTGMASPGWPTDLHELLRDLPERRARSADGLSLPRATSGVPAASGHAAAGLLLLSGVDAVPVVLWTDVDRRPAGLSPDVPGRARAAHGADLLKELAAGNYS
jgi:hypothetical protein